MNFRPSQQLKCIFWPEGEELKVGSGGVLSIEVVMENGQMMEVPWVVVFFQNGKVQKYNLALCMGVEKLLSSDPCA